MNSDFLKKLQSFAPLVLRVGLGLVMLWFGTQQLRDTLSWVGYLPDFVSSLPVSEITFVKMNGIFEVVFGLLLIAGFYARIVALLLALHLFGIASTVGYNDVGVRDFGLSMALFSIAFHGAGAYSFDELIKRRSDKK